MFSQPQIALERNIAFGYNPSSNMKSRTDAKFGSVDCRRPSEMIGRSISLGYKTSLRIEFFVNNLKKDVENEKNLQLKKTQDSALDS